jgi:hypothetical protein
VTSETDIKYGESRDHHLYEIAPKILSEIMTGHLQKYISVPTDIIQGYDVYIMVHSEEIRIYWPIATPGNMYLLLHLPTGS